LVATLPSILAPGIGRVVGVSMQRALKWIGAAVLGLVLVAVIVAAAGSLLSLDWSRHHAAATASLPVFRGFGGDEVVRIPARGMEFRARVAGAQGEGVILLHGFPVTSAMWQPLLTAAGAAGYRAVAFDQRGYSPGARPDDVESYAAAELVDDVLAVADALGFEHFHLVGHDWGSAIGWGVVLRAPERVQTWSSLSIPHPAAFLGALNDDPDQQARSAYFRLFSTPWVPEVLFTFNGLASLREGVYAEMTSPQREEYLRVFAEPGAISAALNYYRAIPLSRATADVSPDIERPTLFVWGNRDPAVGRSSVAAQRPYMKGPYREVELEGGHWIVEEQGPRVIQEILTHWKGDTVPGVVAPAGEQGS
jgi:pimeloyl-ACP methyl ester carboxylesterase